jgi:hypothetical protein
MFFIEDKIGRLKNLVTTKRLIKETWKERPMTTIMQFGLM